MSVSSTEIKEALMHYFRFKRGWVCADEVYSGNGFIGDIVVDTNKYTMEVEIKISKSDLINGEKRKTTGWKGKGKNKHDESIVLGRTNKFALCVPENLSEIAEEWIKNTNRKYGLYIYTDKPTQTYGIITKKTALKLHNQYNIKTYLYRIARRLSGARAMEFSSRRQRIENDK